MYTADIDVGGTFTDGFFADGADWRRSKTLTTPHDLTECFIACLRDGAGLFGVSLKEFLRDSLVVRLSTTLGTNTLIQRRGPRIGLLVSRGHEEDLYGSGRAAVLDLFLQPEMVIGIREQVDEQGQSIVAPDPAEVLAAVRKLVEQGARMIAISLAGSWRNPAHERTVRTVVRERYPEHYLRSIPLQLGHEVSPAADDHARTNTVLLNTYLHRELARGLYRAEDLARENGMGHPLLVVHAGGGCARVAKTVAIQTLSSGPAVAVSGSAAVAAQLGLDRVITADMGGTSLDVAVLRTADRRPPTADHQPVGGTTAAEPGAGRDGLGLPVSYTPRVAGIPLALPMIDTESIGAGGGSIARVENGELRVGPQSAGSAPGPACYDKGGMEPTVTDANLVLGFLDPDRFLGGRMTLNRKRGEDAITRRLVRQLGGTLEDVAATIRDQIDRTMAAEIVARLRQHGGDPGAFTLFAFGGGGPVHACAIAEQAGIRRVVGFPFGSVFSAFGSSTVDVGHQYWRNVVGPLELATQAASEALTALRRQAALDMRGEGFAPDQVVFSLELVLHTPSGERRMAWPADDADGGVDTRAVLRRLREEGPPDEADRSELRAVVLDARVPIPHWLPTAETERAHRPEVTEHRPVRWQTDGQMRDTPVYQYGALEPGAELQGPAIVEAPDTLYAVNPGWQARIDGWGNVVMERG